MTSESKIKIAELSVLSLFIVLYVWNISHYFWTLPAPSDPLQYLGPMVWKSTYAYWPWFDRLSLAIGLRVFSMIIPTTYIAGPIYVGFINTLIIVVSTLWLYRKQGFMAAALVCLFFNTSFFLLGFATYIYPVQTEAFYALLAFIFFFAEEKSRIYHQRILFAGMFCAFAFFSKITGAFATIYFIIYLVRFKSWKDLSKLVAGVIIGTLVICLLFIALFNIQSFFDILSLFFKSNQWSGRKLNNLVSFLDQILSVKFIPVFISLFMAVNAYKQTMSRRLFCFSWANITVLYIIYTFTHRGGSVISPYIYSAYIFAGIGLASVLGSTFTTMRAPSLRKYISDKSVIIGVSLLCLMLICAGLMIGMKYPIVDHFDYGYLYYKPFDVFVPGNISIPEECRWLFTLGPILVLILLLLTQLSKSRIIIILFMIMVSLWGGAFHGGLAYQKVKFDRSEAGFFYKAAPILNEVPDEKFDIFVREWNKRPRSERLIWVYRHFYDKKYLRGYNYDSQSLNDHIIRKNINYIKEEKCLAALQGKQILTDDISSIKKYFQEYSIVKEFDWQGTKLYVVNVSSPEPLWRSNFEDWIGPNIVNDKEINKVAPFLKIGGIRGGFKFERILGEENILRIIPEKIGKNDKLLVQLSLADEKVLDLNNSKKTNVIFSVEVKMPNNSTGSEVFIQDKYGEWDREWVKIDSDNSWRKYNIYKKLNDNSTEISMGIYWDPFEKKEVFEIKNVLVYAW